MAGLDLNKIPWSELKGKTVDWDVQDSDFVGAVVIGKAQITARGDQYADAILVELKGTEYAIWWHRGVFVMTKMTDL